MANDLEISSAMLRSGCAGFDDALVALKHGQAVTRKGWRANHHLKLMPAPINPDIEWEPFISFWPGESRFFPRPWVGAWTASQNDLLAEDWKFYEPNEGERGFALIPALLIVALIVGAVELAKHWH